MAKKPMMPHDRAAPAIRKATNLAGKHINKMSGMVPSAENVIAAHNAHMASVMTIPSGPFWASANVAAPQ